jgi:hypothetical protein
VQAIKRSLDKGEQTRRNANLRIANLPRWSAHSERAARWMRFGRARAHSRPVSTSRKPPSSSEAGRVILYAPARLRPRFPHRTAGRKTSLRRIKDNPPHLRSMPRVRVRFLRSAAPPATGGNTHQTSNPPANVRPAPTLQKMILSPTLKISSSAAQPRAIETLAAEVLPYLPIVTTNFS